MPATLEDLLAEAQIRDIHLRYCRANDRLDAALMRSCFHPDAVIELHESFTVEAFIAMGQASLTAFSTTWHNTGNQLVEVTGDTAWAEHYTTSSHRFPAGESGPERDLVVFGRYIDRLEKREGTWRIARRKLVIDYTRTDPVGAGVMPPSGGGSRDHADPSYAGRLAP